MGSHPSPRFAKMRRLLVSLTSANTPRVSLHTSSESTVPTFAQNGSGELRHGTSPRIGGPIDPSPVFPPPEPPDAPASRLPPPPPVAAGSPPTPLLPPTPPTCAPAPPVRAPRKSSGPTLLRTPRGRARAPRPRQRPAQQRSESWRRAHQPARPLGKMSRAPQLELPFAHAGARRRARSTARSMSLAEASEYVEFGTIEPHHEHARALVLPEGRIQYAEEHLVG
jgi:hypothetical protein